MKTFYFLAGLPRSGNTLLSALLNQNPNIYSSPLSPLCQYFYQLDSLLETFEHNKRTLLPERNFSVTANLLSNFYFDVDKPIVFDREKSWGTPANLQIIKKHITQTPKIIFTNRDLLEILASFISILSEDSYLDKEMFNSGWYYKDYLSKNDNRVEYLMRPFGEIDKTLLSFNEIKKEENKNIFHIVDYNKLVSNPDAVFKKLYDFLELDYFQHSYDSIVKNEVDYDESLGYPDNLHKIKTKLEKTSNKPESLLSDYIIQKYKNYNLLDLTR